MKQFLYFLMLLSCFLFCSPLSIRAMGLGDYSLDTPYNNQIADNGSGNRLYLRNTKEFYLNKWYFYKNHIIATDEPDIYYVVNEKTLEVHQFQDEASFNLYLERSDLIPKFWTRWYHDNWQATGFVVLLYLTVFGFFTYPILIVFGISYYKSIKKYGFKFWDYHFIILLLVVSYLTFHILAGYYPESI